MPRVSPCSNQKREVQYLLRVPPLDPSFVLMTLFDIIVAIVLGLCCIYSLLKGAVREIFSLLGYLASYILAINFQSSLAETLKEVVTQPIAAQIVGFITIFLGVKFAFTLLGRLILRFVGSGSVLPLFDRILGGMLGLAKGLVILVVIMFPLSLFEDTYKKATQGSVLAPHMEAVIATLSSEVKNRNLLDSLPDISVDGIKEQIDRMENLDKLSQGMEEVKDKIIGGINGKPQEEYTKEDKKKLGELLDSIEKE